MNSRTALALSLTGLFAVPAVLAQPCNPNIRPSAPDARYDVDLIKGTVLDKQTGLIWKRCVEGLSGSECGAGQPVSVSWGAALRRAAASDYAGYKDWRLPNSKELGSLVEVACYDPALNATVFPNAPLDSVWSSSPDSTSRGGVYACWTVDFRNGWSTGVSGCTNNLFIVRLVRGGK